MSPFTNRQLADRFAVTALALAAVASAAGLFIPKLYRDTEPWVRQAQASDLTTLVLAVPLLGIGLWRRRAGSATGYLVTLGVLAFLVYGYAIFSFAVATNPMSPLHYAILGLGTWSLVLHGVGLDFDGLGAAGLGRLPRRTTGWFLLGVAALFAVLWGRQIATSIVTGKTAAEVAVLGLTTNPVWALDLAFALPFLAVAGVGMLRNRGHAIVAALPALVFIVVMGLSILVIFAFDALAGQPVDIVPVALIALLVAVATILTGSCIMIPLGRATPSEAAYDRG
jgi:hypothetical protein